MSMHALSNREWVFHRKRDVTWVFLCSRCLLLVHRNLRSSADDINGFGSQFSHSPLSPPPPKSSTLILTSFLSPFSSLSPFLFLPEKRSPHMTRRLPSRADRKPTAPRQLPTITYRHIPAPTAQTLARAPSQAMDRTGYPNTRRPAFASRRSSSHISRRDPTDFNNNNNNNDGHRTLTMRPRYPDRSKSTVGYDSGMCGGVVFCAPQRPGALRQAPMSGSYIDNAFAGLDEMPRRGEVYEMPIPYSSDIDGTTRGRCSTQTSRPSSRGSELVYAEYEDDEERERKRFLGSELYGYVMAMRLKERLVDVRQVLNLYRDFDHASGCESIHL